MIATGASSVWAWHPHPDVWALVLVLGIGYAMAVRRLGPRLAGPGEARASRSQVVAFAGGIAALWVAGDWPVHDLGEESLYSVHMVQHLLLALIAPPLLLLGTPGWLARWLLRPRWLLSAVRFAARPLVALAIFNGVLVFTHWPAVVEVSLASEAAHFGLHVLVLGSGLAMWLPVASPLLEVPRLSYPGRMGYLFLQSLVPTVPASFLTFGQAPLYQVYEALPRLGGMTALTDQRLAGLIMKLVGGLILWLVIAVLFFRWHARESSEGSDALGLRDIDRGLNRVRLVRP